ncbi:hypothetical protein [Pseudomonas soli]|uniref:hypothetical protein n=1 Tax=Pseudomonas soli TaxID=1306993 RepID=UPI003DA9CDFA
MDSKKIVNQSGRPVCIQQDELKSREIDIATMVLDSYANLPAEALKRRPPSLPANLHPQAAEMFVWMAAHAVDRIGDRAEHYLDYSVPVTGLALTYCLVAVEQSTTEPDFSRPSRPDPSVHAAFGKQLMEELNREQHARVQQGIWQPFFDIKEDIAQQRLTRRRRGSALMMLDAKAKMALLEMLIGKSLSELSLDELNHAIASSPEMLHFLTQSDPPGWLRFEQTIGVDAERLAALTGFLIFLQFAADQVNHSYWYDEAKLIQLWGIYTLAYPQYGTIAGQSMVDALTRFSMAPSESATTLIHPPFYLLHGKFLRNPCFINAQGMTASLLTIAIRRHERDWNNTLGSTLARAADTLKALLPVLSHLKVAVRRKFPGGDVDLALYDTQSNELLVCEVKTVYDKHNVDSLMHRFEEAKVNVDKATSQLDETALAISGGQLSMMRIFGEKLAAPKAVHKVLLTWLDPVDLTMGTVHEEVMCMNFAIFIGLIHASEGNVQVVATTAHELRNIWSVALSRPLDLSQPELTAKLEVQTNLLDSRSDLESLGLSPLSSKIIAQMGSVDEVTASEQPASWISYLSDSMRVLRPSAP